MAPRSTYQPAQPVSETVEAHFRLHLQQAIKGGETELGATPQAPMIEAMIDTAFWTSLRREEGHSPKTSLAFLPPDQASRPLILGNRLSLSPANLIKLAPAVEPSGIHLGVWHENGELYLWGTTRNIPPLCLVIEVVEPGLLVIKHRRVGGFGKFINLVILKGDQVKVVDEKSANLPDCPNLLTSLLGIAQPSSWNGSVNVMVQLAASMRAHARGGSLLVIPSNSQNWPQSIIHPISYPIMPLFSGLAELVKSEKEERNTAAWQSSISREVESVARLTAVDGATLVNEHLQVLAFGAKIGRAANSTPVEQIIVTEPIIGSRPVIVHPAQHGGTRHLSAAQFVFDQRDCIALVASQDGRFTIFAWSFHEKMVHAHRVESLLL